MATTAEGSFSETCRSSPFDSKGLKRTWPASATYSPIPTATTANRRCRNGPKPKGWGYRPTPARKSAIAMATPGVFIAGCSSRTKTAQQQKPGVDQDAKQSSRQPKPPYSNLKRPKAAASLRTDHSAALCCDGLRLHNFRSCGHRGAPAASFPP